jgi:hypothetical protein
MVEWVDGLVFMDGKDYENLQILLKLIVNPAEGYVKIKDMPCTLDRAVRMATDLCQAADSIQQLLPNLESINNGVFTPDSIRKIPFFKQLIRSRDEFNYFELDSEELQKEPFRRTE